MWKFTSIPIVILLVLSAFVALVALSSVVPTTSASGMTQFTGTLCRPYSQTGYGIDLGAVDYCFARNKVSWADNWNPVHNFTLSIPQIEGQTPSITTYQNSTTIDYHLTATSALHGFTGDIYFTQSGYNYNVLVKGSFAGTASTFPLRFKFASSNALSYAGGTSVHANHLGFDWSDYNHRTRSTTYSFSNSNKSLTFTVPNSFSMDPVALDTSATGTWSTGTSFTITLSTKSLNDYIIVGVTTSGSSITISSNGVADSESAVTWQISARSSTVQCSSSPSQESTLIEWYGVEKTGDLLLSDVITITLSGTPTAASGVAFGVSGTAGFDTTAGLPFTASGACTSTAVAPIVTGVDTTQATDLVFAIGGTYTATAETTGDIQGGSTNAITVASSLIWAEYVVSSVHLSSSYCAFGSLIPGYWGILCDALAPLATEGVTLSQTNSAPIDATNPLTTSLATYWPLDEDVGSQAFDLSGNGNTGTLSTAGTGTATWVFGKFGYGVSVTGDTGAPATDVGDVYTTTATGLATPSALSVFLWIYPTSLAGYGTAFALYDSGTPVARILVESTGQLWLQLYGSSGEDNVATATGQKVATKAWSLVGFTYDGTTARVYINGADTGTDPTTVSGSLSTINYVYIGDSEGVQYNLNGYMDDFRVYTSALSSSSVTALYGDTPPPEQVVAISGCSPSQSFIPMDGKQYTFSATPDCSITYTMPSALTNAHYQFSSGNTYSYTTAGSGGTDLVTQKVYYQLSNTYTMYPSSPTNWDGSYTEYATGYLLGNPGSHICGPISLTTSSGAVSCSGYADYGTIAGLPSSFSSSVSGVWSASPYAWTDTTGGNTYVADYTLCSSCTATTTTTTTTTTTQVAPTQVDQADTGINVWLPSTNTYIEFGNPAWFNSAAYSSKEAYFTDFALGSSSNPTQTFGVGITSGNAIISDVEPNFVTFGLLTCGATCQLYYYYQMPAGDSNAYPQVVNVVTSSQTSISASQYLTSSSAFASCTAPCVFVNSANSTMAAKVATGTTSVSFLYDAVLSVSVSPVTIDSGQIAELTAVPTGGSGSYAYVWYQGATCSGAVLGQLASYTTPTLTNPPSSDTYCLQVTDSRGNSATTPVTVTVIGPLSVSVSPVTIDSGQSTTLTAVASGGSGTYSTYAWYSGSTCTGTPLQSGPTDSYATVTLTNPPSSDVYCVQVTDSLGSTAQATVTVTVLVPSVEVVTLLNVYNSRPDLQAAYPQVETSNVVNLVNWAYGVSTGQWTDSSYSTLAPYAYWYTLMYTYNNRPDLQSAFPSASTSMSSYTSLINWAGCVVTTQCPDSSYNALVPFGYWYALVFTYNQRSDLQSAFLDVYTSQSQYQALINWAGGVVAKQWTDSSYNTLAPFGYYYDLMMVYNSRPDLQSAFPSASTSMSSYTSLVNWAGGVATLQWTDSSYSTLSPYGYYYDLMTVYNSRPDLQAAFPNAYTSMSSYTSLINWAGGVVTKQWTDSMYSTLNAFGYYYDLMMVYNSRPDLQAAFPNAYTSQTQYQGLINWASAVVTGAIMPLDSSYSLLVVYASYYESLAT